MIRKQCIFFSLILCFCIALFANAVITQGIRVYSSVDSTNIGIDEQVHLRYTIAGAGFFKKPDLPDIKDFSVILTAQYTGIDFSNKGKPVPYTVFEYMFMPLKEGTLKIPKIHVKFKGYFHSSDEYLINVNKKIKSVDFKETTSTYQPFVGNIDTSPIFIQSRISSSNVFYNQQIIYTYTIFTSIPILKLPKVKIPQFDSFHKEDLYYKREYWTKISNQTYRAFEFKFALFPYMTDTQRIPPVQMVLQKSDFPASALNQLDTFVKNTNSFNVNITALPLKDKPLSFSGLIGEFEITSEVESKEIALNEFVILTVKIKGKGNIRSIPHIKSPIMQNLREYNSDVFMNFDRKQGDISGEKLFKFALLGSKPGKETIPSIGFSYFDQKEGKYLTKWTEPIEITITKAKKTDESKSKKFKFGCKRRD